MAEETTDQDTQNSTPHSEPAPKAKPARVLIVEPYKTLARYIGDALRSEGHKFEHVRTSEDAVAALTSDKFDAVFCAWMLPDNTGFRLRGYVEETMTIETLPFVLMLNDISQLNFREAEQAGLKTYLPKGSSPAKICANLRVALREAEAEKMAKIADETVMQD